MDIKTYLSKAKKTVEQFAAEASISGQAVYKYQTGKRIPRKSIIQKITLITGGAVTANDFYNLPPSSELNHSNEAGVLE